MNIKSILLVFGCAYATVYTNLSFAALIDRGGGMLYDEDLDITWLADANYAFTSGYDVDGLMTYQESQIWADQLVFGGYDDWRLPRELSSATAPYCVGFDCTDTEMAHLYLFSLGGDIEKGRADLTGDQGPFINIMHQYWMDLVVSDTRAMNFHFSDGLQFDHLNDDLFTVWAVRDGDVSSVAAVPIPAAAWLFSAGLLALAGVTKRKGKVFV